MMDKKELQQEIKALESKVANMQDSLDSMQENLNCLKDFIRHLKDIAWDRDSKKESSKMYKVLENDKPSTIVRSNVGDVIVDREFMEKEIHKHLDNPALRGMVTTEEMLSFSKVAKNIEPEYNPQQQGYDWKAKTNDENIIVYGNRKYIKEDKKINRLLTAHTKTERGERGHSHRQISDPNFHNSVGETIPQNNNESYMISKENSLDELLQRDFSPNLTLEQQISLLKQASQIGSIPRVNDTTKNTQARTQTSQNDTYTKPLRRKK